MKENGEGKRQVRLVDEKVERTKLLSRGQVRSTPSAAKELPCSRHIWSVGQVETTFIAELHRTPNPLLTKDRNDSSSLS